MMKLQAIFTVLAISSTVFAADKCDKAAIDLAKMNLDSKAKAYAFPESYVNAKSLKLLSQSKDVVSYSMIGNINKAGYTIQIDLDSTCSIMALKIQESF